MIEQRLKNSIAAVCPINDIAIIDASKKQVRIDYKPEATVSQRIDAQAAVTAFDWIDDGQKQLEAKSKMEAIAKDPALTYLLSQIGVAVAGYKVPDASAIMADPVFINAVKARYGYE